MEVTNLKSTDFAQAQAGKPITKSEPEQVTQASYAVTTQSDTVTISDEANALLEAESSGSKSETNGGTGVEPPANESETNGGTGVEPPAAQALGGTGVEPPKGTDIGGTGESPKDKKE